MQTHIASLSRYSDLGGGGASPAGGELWRDLDDLLTVSEQVRGDVPADAAAALDGPDPLGPALRLPQQACEAMLVCAVAAAAEHLLIKPQHLYRD